MLSDAAFLKLKYWLIFRKKLDIKNPKTFSEKLQWLKLNNRKEQFTHLVDKYEVRKHITAKIGDEYLVPLIGVYDQVGQIDWNALPRRFVLKCTHGSGYNIICADKDKLDIANAKKKLNKWMKMNWYWNGREWPYKNVTPKIVCETFISDGENTPDDYKVLCFNGVAKLIEVHMDRFGNHAQDFYDENWNKTKISQDGTISNQIYTKPQQFNKMIQLSEKLAFGIPQIRIDWYIVGQQLYFGEITFFDGSGLDPFDHEPDDQLLGSWIDLHHEESC